MIGPFVIEPLSREHDRAAFRCGSEALDRHLRTQLTQDMRRRITNGFVAVDREGRVAGFYTLAATGVPITDLPAEVGRRLPRYPLLPAGLVGRLAVDQRARGQGLGAALLLDAIARAARAEPAIFALLVDAKDDAAVAFYQHLGFRPLASRPQSLFLPIAEAVRRLAG